MNKIKIAFVMITNGLEYDDRIRKEIKSMQSIMNVDFKIFAFHGDNRSEKGILSYGVPYEIVSLKLRGHRKDIWTMIKKEYDFYSQIKKRIQDFDLLWIVDDQPFFFPLFSKKKVIWDLHEIPAAIIGGKLKNILFRYMEKRCKALIHANNERMEYLIDLGIIKKKEKNFVLRNYPDKEWINQACHRSQSYSEFLTWLGDTEYIYIQGIVSASRFPIETLSAIMEIKSTKAVVIGSVPQEVKLFLSEKYHDLEQFVFFTGQLNQSETASFIAGCKFSIVLYSTDTANNKYCEPNRMFQCLAFGKPVIVGNNPTLTDIISHYNNGVTMKTDGRNLADNKSAILTMINNYDEFAKNAYLAKDAFLWENQIHVFRKLFEKH